MSVRTCKTGRPVRQLAREHQSRPEICRSVTNHWGMIKAKALKLLAMASNLRALASNWTDIKDLKMTKD